MGLVKYCVAIGFLAFFLFPVQILHAVTFNPSYILSDIEFIDREGRDVQWVQQFLNRNTGILKRANFIDIDGFERPAAEIIYRAAVNFQINPQVILSTLQKEQSLIENGNPSSHNLDWAMGYALCDDCRSDDPTIQKYRGFAAQIYYGTSRLREYLDRPEEFRWIRINVPTAIDGQSIVITNDATRALYLYTPHFSGNEKFWKLWNRYFSRIHPDGSIVQARGTSDFWLIDNGMRRRFESFSVLSSRYNPEQLITIAPSDLERYPLGTPIRFVQYSLVRSSRGTVYLIADGYKRGFTSSEALRRLGFSPFEIEDVGEDALNDYPDGEPITTSTNNPTGILLQNKLTGAVFFAQDGVKFPIKAREILKANYPYARIKPVTAEELTRFQDGSAIGFADGALLKSASDPTVYVISHGLRRAFMSEEIFTGLGFKWENIIYVPDSLLSLHSLGDPLDFPTTNAAIMALNEP